MSRRLLKAHVLVLLGVGILAFAQGKYDNADPDSAQVNGAAKEALARAHVLDIRPTVLDIKGVSSGIQSVLQDLGAKVVGNQLKIELASDVLFDFDKYSLRPEANDALRKVGAVASAYPKSPLLIEGHTDGKGTHAYNIKLSENRAASVKDWLVQNASVVPSRITTRGWGEARPVAPNKNPDGSDNPEGRQKNRRVEIVLTQVSS
jgi:outer membrane protein OmpA-like peptidoglycan-associated protein